MEGECSARPRVQWAGGAQIGGRADDVQTLALDHAQQPAEGPARERVKLAGGGLARRMDAAVAHYLVRAAVGHHSETGDRDPEA